MPEASIVISASDNYSSAIKSMSSITKSFSKDQDEMQKKLDALKTNQHGLQNALKDSGSKLRDLDKRLVDATSSMSEADKAALKLERDAEQARFDNIQRNLALVSKGAREAENQMKKTGEAFSSVSRGTSKSEGVMSVVGAFAANGFGQIIGDVLTNLANVAVASAGGSDVGSIFSNALAMGVSGAAIGTMIAPGLGTAIGAGAGAIAGAISGRLQVWQNQDEAFKSYYTGIIDDQAAAREAGIQSGSGTSATRESDLKALTALMSGDKEAAASFQQQLIGIGRMPPFSYSTATTLAKDMLGLGLDQDAILSRIDALSNADLLAEVHHINEDLLVRYDHTHDRASPSGGGAERSEAEGGKVSANGRFPPSVASRQLPQGGAFTPFQCP